MPSRLTFGVEFEFAFALLEEGQVEPEPELPQPATFLPTSSHPNYCKLSDEVKNGVYDLIVTKMVAAGLPTRCMTLEISPDSSQTSSSDKSGHVQDDGIGWIPSRRRRPCWVIPLQTLEQVAEKINENADLADHNSRTGVASKDEFGSQWMVTEDISIAPTKPLDYVWYPIEVQSPPYIFCEDSLQAVRLACQVITGEFRVETNATTGLHVHVGDGADGYALKTVKKLMAFLWTFEPQIDQLHPKRRARISDNEAHTWYESLRRGSILCGRRSLDESFPMKVLDGLKIIFDTGDIDDLNTLMSPAYNKSAYKIEHLIYSDTIKRTVEFRQHEGTMHGTRVVEWIKTVVALVEWTMDIQTTALVEFLEEAADFEDRCWPEEEKPPYDIIDLFNDMGLVEQAIYWDQAIPKNIRNKPTEYYQRPRRPRKLPSASENDISSSDDTANEYDEKNRARRTTPLPNQTPEKTSDFWRRHFLEQGGSELRQERPAETVQAPENPVAESG
jgi:hypothetical protein